MEYGVSRTARCGDHEGLINRPARTAGLKGPQDVFVEKDVMDSGLGDHSAQDVERFLSLYAVGVDSHVSMESVTISLSVSAARGCAIHIAAPSFYAWARLHAVGGVHTPGRSSAHVHSHLVRVCFLTQRDGHR